jgi:3'-phosphoadenosine 5'-phosphosulfate sulfotransferase (PAPS reductase)/FAD synthetase
MKIGLAFSGGKDSLACLFLHRDQLQDITVIWVNTGKAYPETLAIMDMARSMAPNFAEVRVDRDAQNAAEGIPSDVVPIAWTALGCTLSGEKPVRIQSHLGCCFQNISAPLHQTAKDLGITHLIRGQRLDEDYKSPARDGDVVDGITYIQPIEHWTKAQVMAYLEEQMEIPPHLLLDHSSLDCYDCTGFADHSLDRAAWAKQHHPDLHAKHMERVVLLQGALADAMKNITALGRLA